MYVIICVYILYKESSICLRNKGDYEEKTTESVISSNILKWLHLINAQFSYWE